MEYTHMQLQIFSFIESLGLGLGFDKADVKKIIIDPDLLTITVKGEYPREEVTHVLNIRAERN